MIVVSFAHFSIVIIEFVFFSSLVTDVLGGEGEEDGGTIFAQ